MQQTKKEASDATTKPVAEQSKTTKSLSEKSPKDSLSGTKEQARSSTTSASGKNPTVKITIKYDVGFGNLLHIRGQGVNGLSWQKGIPLKNIKPNEWVWETSETFTKIEFKILINDFNYETGPNHIVTYGSTMQYTPHFPHH